ncbi:MAG: heliorhodopsin HeR [Acidimicrobiales bacterium]|jgi:hypothetical protein
MMLSSTIERLPGEVNRIEEKSFVGLRRFNAAMAALHALSGSLMAVLSNDFEVQISTFTLNGPPGTPLSEGTVSEVWGVPLGLATSVFLFLSAMFHLAVVVGPGHRAYRRELIAGRNRFRWIEYSASATLMIVLIALVSGITDLAALIAIAGVNIAMILFGWIMEMANPPRRPTWWTPFWFGSVAGVIPWAAVIASIAYSASRSSSGGPPTFVYGIVVTIFLVFNCFAVNQWLQFRKIGRWKDYLHGERTYITLSLVAKSLLAWQIFANTLID